MDSAPYIPTSDYLFDEPVGTFDPWTASLNTTENSYDTVAWVPIMQRGWRLGAPNPNFDLGWHEGMVDTNVDVIPVYETQAPDVVYTPLTYTNLMAEAANPPVLYSSHPGGLLRAPGINEGMY
jgi:hypothetical protein